MRGPQQGRGILFVLGGAAVACVVALAAGLGIDPRTILAPLEPVRPAPAPASGSAQPTSDATPQLAETPRGAPPPAPPPELPAPSFDVVRVEPTGESVIAGRSVAGATVEMLRDGQVHARTAADQSGLFAFVPPPLQPGSHQVTLQSIAPDGSRQRSRDSVTIVVDEGRSIRPLVALTSPDKPTVLLSNPEAPEPKTEATKSAELARPEPKPEAGPAQGGPAQAGPAQAIPAERQSAEAKPGEVAGPELKPAEEKSAGPAGADPNRAASSANPSAPQGGPSGPGLPPTAPAPPPTPAQRQAGVEPSAPARPQPGAEAAQEPARPAPPPPAGGPPPPRPEVKITTVEAEQGGRLYVSGQAAPGSTVRLYLNETLIAPGGAGADGKVAFAIGRGVRPGEYRVRIDDVDPVSGAVKSRAEVAFNVPAPLATALDETPIAPGPQVAAAPPTQVQPPVPSTPQPSGPPPAAAPESGSQPSSGGPPDVARPSIAGAPSSRTDAAPGASPANGPQVASATPPEMRDFPPGTIVIPDVSTAIVSRGDNLWRISQRIYGKGVRYTVIYGANQRQIRNPNLIYPGQVFVLPDNQGRKEP